MNIVYADFNSGDREGRARLNIVATIESDPALRTLCKLAAQGMTDLQHVMHESGWFDGRATDVFADVDEADELIRSRLSA
ncbi:MAG: hypothetical protein ACREMY_04995 [bacterium]